MQKHRIIFAVALSSALLTSTAIANSTGKTYAGIQYIATHTTYDAPLPSFNIPVIAAKFGYNITNNFSIEGRLGTGLSTAKGSVEHIDIDIDMKVDHMLGVYGILKTEISNQLNIYGLLGLTRAQTTATVTNTVASKSASGSDTDSSVSFGGGLEYKFSPKQSVSLEYASYLRGSNHDNNYDTTGFAISFQTQF